MIRLLLLLLALASPAAAHFGVVIEGPPLPTGFAPDSLTTPDADLGLAQVTAQSQAGRIDLQFRFSGMAEISAPILPESCRAIKPMELDQAIREARLSLSMHCDSNSGALLLPWRLEMTRLLVLSDAGGLDTILQAGPLGVALPMSLIWPEKLPWHDIGFTYLISGVEHVLGGLDHLAFVFCLLLMARARQIWWLITAFTLGHSVTLILAALGHVSLPIAPVEASIALSIVFLAREAWLGVEVGRREIGLTIGFGLLHGLGFASALSEVGLPARQETLALLAFNLGVELGQILFVGAVLLLAYGIGRLSTGSLHVARIATLLMIGAVAIAWTTERVLLVAA
ncbi:MAG: HupE/UreJ family protein [Mangrovicoccus sp.]